jgi:hypothetical protein
MKKFLVLLFFLGLAAVYVASPVFAAASDTFYITVTISNIDISLLDGGANPRGTWEVGTVALNTLTTMDANSGTEPAEDGVHVKNDSNVVIDLECSADDTEGWAFAGSAGSNQCVLLAKSFSSWQAPSYPDMSGAVTVPETGSTVDVDTSVPATTDRFFYYSLTTPTSVTTYNPNTITVTVTGTL